MHTHITSMSMPSIIRSLQDISPQLTYAIWFSNLCTMADATTGRAEVAVKAKAAKAKKTAVSKAKQK
jgi:hypothetical protein